MRIARTAAELVAAREGLAGRVGFVPTMGNLHRGHLRLIEAARDHADAVLVSIFVNPLQFGPGEDFGRYPRTFDADVDALRAHGVDLVYAPTVDDVYPDGADRTPRVSVPSALGDVLDGASRPGHFDGVATVVKRLFELVAPDIAVFGDKDFQQLLVIRWLVERFALPVKVFGEPTVRDPDGLALSSRNQYLTADERARAPALFTVLTAVAGAVRAGERDWAKLSQRGRTALEHAGFDPDYLEIRDALTLAEPGDQGPWVVLGAARLGRARLIDNLRV